MVVLGTVKLCMHTIFINIEKKAVLSILIKVNVAEIQIKTTNSEAYTIFHKGKGVKAT